MRTGWSRFYPEGEGLFGYDDRKEAAAAIAAIAADYKRHSRAARAIAAEYFESDGILAALLSGCGL